MTHLFRMLSPYQGKRGQFQIGGLEVWFFKPAGTCEQWPVDPGY